MSKLYMTHPVFPTPDIKRTSKYYVEKLGFEAVEYLDAQEPHICLYKDNIEIILTDSKGRPVIPNRELYGYGYDAYVIADDQEQLQRKFEECGVKIARRFMLTEYHNAEFVIEDIDGRWIGFGIKT